MKIDTIRDLILDYLREQRELSEAGDTNALAAGTLRNYRASLEGPIMDAFGTMRPKAFKPTHAAQFLLAARKAGRPVAGNRDVAALAAAFNHGMGLGVVDSNPCRGVRRNRERPRTRSVSIAEFNDLLKVAEEMEGGYLMVALIAMAVALTGRRRGELLDLPLSQIDERGIWTADKKTKRHGERTYLIRWSPMLKQAVTKAQRMRPGTEWVFPSRFGRPYTDQGFKANWNRLIRAYEAKHGERFRAHDLRALYVSTMLDRDENPNTHASEATMRRVYDRRRVIEVLPMA